MSSKWFLLVVITVAVMIPAVAVADVMISGDISVQGKQAQDAFMITTGPNYKTANMSHLFGWVPETTSLQESMGTAWIGTMSNETITEVNVLEINFTSGVAKNSNFEINVTNGHFANNTFMIVSSSPLSIVSGGNVQSSGETLIFSLYSGNTIVTGNGLGITSGSFQVNSNSHLYIGFYIPPQGGNGGHNGPLINPPTPPDPPGPPVPIPISPLNGPVSGSFSVLFSLVES
jgi:hypothetical protein